MPNNPTQEPSLLPPRGHLPVLDGLRGLAVLLVMIHHFALEDGLIPRSTLEKITQSTASFGWCGVDLFFVLSGFLITGILYDTRNQENYFLTFYSRRIVRIFPLYYLFLTLRFFVFPAFSWTHFMGSVPLSEQWWEWCYLSNIKIALTNRFEGVPLGLGHFWSLAIEEQFYMLWPLLVSRLTRKALLRLCAAVVLGGLLMRWGLYSHGLWVAAYSLTPARLDGLAIGASIALIVRQPNEYARALRLVRPALATILTVLIAMALPRNGLWRDSTLVGTIGYTLLDFGFAALLLLSVTPVKNNSLAKVVANRPLRFLGKYSYGLYVFHMPITFLLSKNGVTAYSLARGIGAPLLGRVCFIALAMILSIVVALVSWHVWEKHFLKLKARFAYAPRQIRAELA